MHHFQTNMQNDTERHRRMYHTDVITGTLLCIYKKLLLLMNGAEWMKEICHLWSRGRHFSPSLPGDRYLNLSSPQKRPPGRNLRDHRSVRRSGSASGGTALLVFCLRMRRFLKIQVLTIFVGKMLKYNVGRKKDNEGGVSSLSYSSEHSDQWSWTICV